jgi:hypothetical protein
MTKTFKIHIHGTIHHSGQTWKMHSFKQQTPHHFVSKAIREKPNSE